MLYKELKIKEFDIIDDKTQGIYVWLLKPKSLTQDKLLKIYDRTNNFDIQLEGSRVFNSNSKFGEAYLGTIKRQTNSNIESKITNVDDEFILKFLSAITVPLYIGRSSNLKNRLKKHYECYLEAMGNISIATTNSSSEIDSEEESKNFGMRLAFFNKEKWFRENELYVQIFSKSEVAYDDIKNIEYYLNRTYKPILGII